MDLDLENQDPPLRAAGAGPRALDTPSAQDSSRATASSTPPAATLDASKAPSSEPESSSEPAEPAEPPTHPLPRRFEALRAALPAWVLGHLVVFAVSWHRDPKHPLAALFEWDTVWYRTIAAHGYAPTGSLIHFFPLTSIGAAGISLATRIPVSVALFGFCWLAGLLFGAALYRLTLFETGDRGAAWRAAWLVQLAPGGYALVMGYTEPLAGLLAVLYFLSLRAVAVRGDDAPAGFLRRHGLWLAAVIGLFCGVSRPTAVVLVLAGTVEGLRIARAAGWRPLTTARAALAAASPALGLFAFLVYSKAEYGSWKMPLSQQVLKNNRGAVFNNPLTSLHFWVYAVGRHNHGRQVALMCALLIVTAALLICVVARRLPASYLVWVVPSYILAITSHIFTSLPRYIGALFPIIMVLALMTRRRWQFYAVLAISILLLAWTSHITFAKWLTA